MKIIKDDSPNHGGVEVIATWTVSAWDCMNVARWFSRGVTLGRIPSTIRDLMLAGFCCLFMLGCGVTETVSPKITERASGLSSSYEKAIDAHSKSIATALAAQKLTGEMTLENTQAIMAKLNTLEASLSAPKPNGQEVIKSAPNPPAKANTQKAPLKVATPGDFSEPETLVELATRLYARGVNTNNKTREELEAIDAQLNGGQAVSGAMFPNNRTSSVTSKRSAVRFVPRGSSVLQWQNYSTQQTCGPGGCPPRRSR
jgi:hypothetical protein